MKGTGLLAGDITGRIHLLDDNLQLRRSSPAVAAGQPIHCLVASGEWVIAKDRLGNLIRWSLDTMDLVDFLSPEAADAGAFPAVTGEAGHRATDDLARWRGRIYTESGSGHGMIIDPESFAVESVIPARSCDTVPPATERSGIATLADRSVGPLPGPFALHELPSAVTARGVRPITYDARHDRFWAVEQNTRLRPGLPVGVVLVSPQGSVEYALTFSRYEIDFLAFSPDAAVAYAGGPEGVLHVIDNTNQKPELAKTVGGFPHQLTDLAVGGEGSLFVLTLSGELVKVDPDVEYVQSRAPVLRQGAWHMAPALDRENRLYCGTDDGVAVLTARETRHGGVSLSQSDRHDSSFGMVRQVAAVPGGYLGLGHREVVFRADHEGALLWSTPLDDLGVGFALSDDGRRALVATGVGAVELDVATGARLDQLSFDGIPLSAAAYGPGGQRILGNHEAGVCAFAADSATELWWTGLATPALHLWTQDGSVYARTSDGLLELDPHRGDVLRQWGGDLRDVTVALVTGGHVYLACSEGELYVYDHITGERTDLISGLPDLPRTLLSVRSGEGPEHLVVGGRGGYLSTYARTPGGTLTRVRDTYLRRGGGQTFRLYAQ
ncbi:outer membrane protein assembly factor BamB family protein [Streptomyces sp. URMC 129]|uniref:outer membrane protein assembly factor BamB family protein n=1 Tax=Streptomyces sp. URMC 129 TaxID=3423407 RepID=UPI003F1DAD6B